MLVQPLVVALGDGVMTYSVITAAMASIPEAERVPSLPH